MHPTLYAQVSPRGGLQPLPLPPTSPRLSSSSTGGNSADGSECGDSQTTAQAALADASLPDMNGQIAKNALKSHSSEPPQLHPANSILHDYSSRPEGSGAANAPDHAQHGTSGVLAVRSKLECLRMGMCTAQGQRSNMEDFAFIMHLAMPHSMSSWFQHGACFGVFDGKTELLEYWLIFAKLHV